MLTFSIGTTLALTKMTHPYLTRIHLHPGPPSLDPTLTMETLNVLARPTYQQARVSQLKPLYNRLMSNIRAVGVGENGSDVDFYLHADEVQHPLLKPLAQEFIAYEAEQTGQGGGGGQEEKQGQGQANKESTDKAEAVKRTPVWM